MDGQEMLTISSSVLDIHREQVKTDFCLYTQSFLFLGLRRVTLFHVRMKNCLFISFLLACDCIYMMMITPERAPPLCLNV